MTIQTVKHYYINTNTSYIHASQRVYRCYGPNIWLYPMQRTKVADLRYIPVHSINAKLSSTTLTKRLWHCLYMPCISLCHCEGEYDCHNYTVLEEDNEEDDCLISNVHVVNCSIYSEVKHCCIFGVLYSVNVLYLHSNALN